MENQAYPELLRQTLLFGDLSTEALESIAGQAEIRQYAAGEWVFRQGDSSHELFIVLEGEFLALISEEDEGYERELGVSKPGDHFGEVGLLMEEGGRNASIRSRDGGSVMAIPRERLLEALQDHPEVALGLCRGFIRYLQLSQKAFLTVPFVEIQSIAHLDELASILSPRIALACKAVVLEKENDLVTVGMVDPHDDLARDFVTNVLKDKRVEFAGIGLGAFERIASTILEPRLGEVVQVGEVPLEYLDADNQPTGFGDDAEALLLQDVLKQAINLGCSDIHFEPRTDGNIVRIRVDGSLFTVRDGIGERSFRRLVARIKAMSQLDVSNNRLPEDGRFVLVSDNNQIEVRVATASCLGGQKAALRLIDAKINRRALDSLFVAKEYKDRARDILLNPNGLVLVVGPTGSGKTTTLYSALNAIWNESQTVNIMTVEDPIEYDLPFATQMQVNNAFDLTFDTLLRLTLRQDPDIVLVGEIRDLASAKMATETAITGHLVLSSLHTDDALDAVVRLRQMGVPPYLLASCLKGVIAQRLVPKVCPKCAVEVGPEDPAYQSAVKTGLLAEDFPGSVKMGTGCEKCRHTGESGRTAVFEILSVNESLQTHIEKETGVHQMRHELGPSTFLSLKEYAGILLKNGTISPSRAVSLFPKFEGSKYVVS